MNHGQTDRKKNGKYQGSFDSLSSISTLDTVFSMWVCVLERECVPSKFLLSSGCNNFHARLRLWLVPNNGRVKILEKNTAPSQPLPCNSPSTVPSWQSSPMFPTKSCRIKNGNITYFHSFTALPFFFWPIFMNSTSKWHTDSLNYHNSSKYGRTPERVVEVPLPRWQHSIGIFSCGYGRFALQGLISRFTARSHQ